MVIRTNKAREACRDIARCASQAEIFETGFTREFGWGLAIDYREIIYVQQNFRRTHIDGHRIHPSTQMTAYGYDPALSEGAVKPPYF